MLKELLVFEIRHHLRHRSFMIFAILLSLQGIISPQLNYGSPEINMNSPFAIAYSLSLISMFSVFFITVLCANAVLRDTRHQMAEIVYSTSVTKYEYLASRLYGIVIIMFLLMCIFVAGMLVGAAFVTNPDRLGPFNLLNYLRPLLIFGIPNILFGTAIVFAAAALTRSIAATYVAGVLVYVLYLLGSALGNSPMMAASTATGPIDDMLPVLIDPYGMVGFLGQARFWSPAERNTEVITLAGSFLINRIFWTVFALAGCALVYKLFSFRVLKRSGVKQITEKFDSFEVPPVRPLLKISDLGISNLSSFFARVRLEFVSIVKSLPFSVMILLWVGIMTLDISEQLFKGFLGLSFHPTTGQIISIFLQYEFGLVLIVFYAADLIWKERDSGIHEIIGAAPVSDKVMLLSKWSSLVLVIVLFNCVNAGLGSAIQLISGYTRLEPWVYASLFYYSGLPMLYLATLALLIQVVVPGKYTGLAVSGTIMILILLSNWLGLEHGLLRFAIQPYMEYTDISGFGHYADAFNWYMVYWGGLAGFILQVAVILVQRGERNSIANRMKSFLRSGETTVKIAMGAPLCIMLGAGAFIYHQTNIVQIYRSSSQQSNWQAEYEKMIKPMVPDHLPTITDVELEVDLYPDERRYSVDGAYIFTNRSDRAIDTLQIGIDPEVNQADIDIAEAELILQDSRFGVTQMKLNKPIMPGDTVRMHFSLQVSRPGFANFNPENSIASNGSYIELEKYVPYFGYSDRLELESPAERRKYGLSSNPEISALQEYTPQSYDWITFRATISTVRDQFVVTIGELQKQWVENDRRYFRYESGRPIPFMFACASAEYDFVQADHKGTKLKVFHDARHGWNVDNLLRAAEKSLSLYDSEFAPYLDSELKIVEIPHYIAVATAYPNTVFITSKFGFLTDLSDSQKVDYTSLMIAHETAHQWWSNQLSPAVVEGSRVLTETLAEHSAHLLLEETQGMRQLRQYFSDHLDIYLSSRSRFDEEVPLFKTFSRNQPYIHYQKGALVMHALKDLLGNDTMNSALRTLLKKHGYPNSKPTTLDLLNSLYDVAPAEHQALIDEWMKKVVLYDLTIESAKYSILEDGKHKVEATIRTDKFLQEGKGLESPLLFAETLNVGIYTEHPDDIKAKNLLLEQFQFTGESTKLEFIVDEKPEWIAVDPYLTRIDKNRYDNVRRIVER